ncbi:hypothetical protein CALCODRAFT_479766 [Calocera cornea HHB12733]|uniref:Rad9-domain-containing protein n=1 Tax=Calocera cornea HHB12733 TaxID=1353952 RepID=A0A165JER8_9BASI|nr:hypothetical protein CALCODRAFT_479766 [Calocera cornea HHB12733]
MEAHMTMASVKMLTKTLICLSRYSDDMDILALPNSLTLSATNSSKSAYCRLLLQPSFFSSYAVRTPGSSFRSADTQVEKGRSVKARLKTKLLLSYLRHRNHDKGVRSATLIIREPPLLESSWGRGPEYDSDDDSEDGEGSVESSLLIKFICDHGVVKQHRLRLDDTEELLAPAVEDNPHEKTVVASRPALQTLLERMRVAMPKADGQISIECNPIDMVVRTVADKGLINTEVKMIGTDLMRYDTGDTTVSLSFHIREFAASLTLAESLDKYLTLTFTEAPAPLILSISPTLPNETAGDDWDFQAFIATNGAAEMMAENSRPSLTNASIAAHSFAFGPTQPGNSSNAFAPLFRNSLLDADEPNISETQEQTDTDGPRFGATQPRGHHKKASPLGYSMYKL